MGVFARDKVAPVAELLDAWRGKLNADLWERDRSRDLYYDTATELDYSLARSMGLPAARRRSCSSEAS